MPSVSTGDLDGFLNEIHARGPNIDGTIYEHLTAEPIPGQPDKLSSYFHARYRYRAPTGETSDLELRYSCGTIDRSPDTDLSRVTHAVADEIYERLASAVAPLGYRLRLGASERTQKLFALPD